MAVLRGGTRIFGQDIRIGIPRDKSLVNIAGDKRLKRRPGNLGTTIGQFIAAVNQGEGVARPARYMVRFWLNEKIKGQLGDFGREQWVGEGPQNRYKRTTDPYSDVEMLRNVSMMCNKVTMPSRDINTTPHITYGPRREMPYAYSFNGTIQCSFYADKYLRQRIFFEKWQNQMFSDTSHNMQYYNDYVGHIDIYQLGASGGEADRDRITYAVRLDEVYPEVIGSLDYGYDQTDQAVIVPIGFRYRTWRNLLIDDIAGASLGKAQGDTPVIKSQQGFGLFGGLLSKLPPELQRVGRDILNAGRRNLPGGRITGG